MDPFSATVAATNLTDVLRRCGIYLDNVSGSTGRINGDINALRGEFNALVKVNEAIESLRKRCNDVSADWQTCTPDANELWNAVEQTRQRCKAVLLTLEEKLKSIIDKGDTSKKEKNGSAKKSKDTENGQSETTGPTTDNIQNRTSGKLDGIRETLREQAIDTELTPIHVSLETYRSALQTLLAALNLIYTTSSRKVNDNAIDDLSKESNALQSKLNSQIQSLRLKLEHGYDASFREATITATKRPINKHFSLPQAVASYFTGREVLLEELRRTLDDDSEDKAQKRFVIQGIGGSGKTQFCCKFAQLNRQKFWGVFSINGASYDTAKEGFAAISRIGGVEPNERAAKAWLSTLEQPWLLIIDNVNDPSVDLETLFPDGERGFILINTRVPEHVKYGTVGPRYHRFEMLESDAAAKLFLVLAQIKRPWDQKTIDKANSIASALGYLPLALVHAGTAIANRLCELDNYLDYHMMYWRAIRQDRKFKARFEETDGTYMNVYSSYEIIYRKLEEESSQKHRDAVELLKIFAFLNREDIRIRTLIAAAKNPSLEFAAKEKAEQETKSNVGQKPESWTQFLRRLLFWVYELLKDRSQPVLPKMVGDVLRGSQNVAEFEYRLRQALHLLNQWSLVTYQEENDSYSMHLLVHVWVRERPEMTLAEQAVWSQAAANALGQSIALPIDGTSTTEEMELQRSLLLHVIHLRGRKAIIREKYCENQAAHRRFLFPFLKPASDLIVNNLYQAMQSAKFSYIYFICGYFYEAEKLQEAVRDFLVPNLGLEHELSMRISLFLAKTYWLGGRRFGDAARLTEQVLQSAEKLLGNRHSTTLKAIDELGRIRLHQGRFPEAENLLQQAIEGRTELLGPKHQDTLCSIDNLGQVYWSMSAFEKAKTQHLKAIDGMASHPQMGPDHEKTLEAKENLALAYREAGEIHYEEALELMEEVVAKRSTMLGRESPFTLMAKSNLAYVKHAMGAYPEAEQIIRQVLPIARRNLGSDHPGVLAMKRRLADILAAQKKDDEAEKIVVQVLDRNKYVDGHDISRRQVETSPDGDNYSDISDRSGTSSIASVFSNISITSGSSMSSLAGSPGAIERLVALLLVDDMIKRLCIKALASFSQEDVEKKLRRLFKAFGVELRKEANTSQQRRAAQFVRVRARNTAHMVCNALKPDERVSSLAMPKAKPLEVDLEESADSDRSDEELDDLKQLEAFIKTSRAIIVLRETLRAFIYPNEAQIKSYLLGERAYPTHCLCQNKSLEGNCIQFIAHSRNDETLRMDVSPSHTIEEIKSRLSNLRGPRIEWQLLKFRADKFEDGISIVQYSIEDGSINFAWDKELQSVESFAMNEDGESFRPYSMRSPEEPFDSDQHLSQLAGVTRSAQVAVITRNQPKTSNNFRLQKSSPLPRAVDLSQQKRLSRDIKTAPKLPSATIQKTGKTLLKPPTLAISKGNAHLIGLLVMEWLKAKSTSITFTIQRLGLLLGSSRPAVAVGKIRVEWQCECGHKSFDDFIELTTGATERYRQAFNSSNSSSTSTRNATFSRISQSLSDGLQSLRSVLAGGAGRSSDSDLPLHERQGPDNQLDQGNSQRQYPTLPQEELLFLLLCYSQDRYATRLLQLDLVTLQATSDKVLFKILRDNYRSMKGILVSCLSLRRLSSIKFVHFVMYPSEFVNVSRPDIPPVPPPENKDYRYQPAPPELIPPVGENYIMHLFEHPHDAADGPFCLNRFPKKLKERLKCISGDMNPGWGLQFVEEWDVRKTWIIGFVFFGLGSLLIGILWAIYGHSIQNAFAIASYMLGFATVTVGTIQALLVL